MTPIGTWNGETPPSFSGEDIQRAAQRIRETITILRHPVTAHVGVAFGGHFTPFSPDLSPGQQSEESGWPVLGILPPLYPEWLGDRSFLETHGTRFPYVTGAMANGIATTRLVIEMAKHGYLGFFGAAGLAKKHVEAGIAELTSVLGHNGPAWGANLIHSPNEPALEAAVADLYINSGVRKVSAAAYMNLTPAIVRYAYSGISRDATGAIHRTNYVFAKISRPEVAASFLAPAPSGMIDSLVNQRLLTPEEGQLARSLPVAEDFTVESDSGGHTDNRPLAALFPVITALRNQMAAEYGYHRPIRLGAAGSLGTPQAVAAAFGLGASYVLTGTVNQACVESGLHPEGKEMLAAAGIADVIMAPAADMFELGAEVQVLKRGTMFGVRAKKLSELYRSYASLDEIPPHERVALEKSILGMSIEECWDSTCAFWQERDPGEIQKAEQEPKHKMALVFRSYLGLSSQWAIQGTNQRRMDYQIWCGPAIGAFNSWTEGSFLADPANRTAVQVANNLLEGAAVVTRAHQLQTYGVPTPPAAFEYRPRPLN